MESVQVCKPPVPSWIRAFIKRQPQNENAVIGHLMRLTNNWWNVVPSDEDFLRQLNDAYLTAAQNAENINNIALACLAKSGDWGEAVDRRLRPDDRAALHDLTQRQAQGALIKAVLEFLL